MEFNQFLSKTLGAEGSNHAAHPQLRPFVSLRGLKKVLEAEIKKIGGRGRAPARRDFHRTT
jgi:hypothetical protein